VEGHKRSIANFSEILDTVVKRSTRALRCANGNPEADGSGERVEYAEKGLCLIGRTVLVNGDEDVVVTEESRDAEEGRKEVWDDVEGVVEVDGEEVFVLSTRKVTSMTVKRGLFLARSRDWVKTTETKVEEPRFGRRWVVADEGGVPFTCLDHVEGIEISCTFTGMMWRESAEDVEDTPPLLEGWRGYLKRRGRVGVEYGRMCATSP